jgi:hypothetical protein
LDVVSLKKTWEARICPTTVCGQYGVSDAKHDEWDRTCPDSLKSLRNIQSQFRVSRRPTDWKHVSTGKRFIFWEKCVWSHQQGKDLQQSQITKVAPQNPPKDLLTAAGQNNRAPTPYKVKPNMKVALYPTCPSV